MMDSSSAWSKALLVASVACTLVVAGLILGVFSAESSGVVALLATLPFIILARFAWGRMQRQRMPG